jgi:hypothetical protein
MSEAENLDRDPLTGHYLPGHSLPGPGRGHVSLTAKPFLESITEAWLTHGADVLTRVVAEKPDIFLRVCASLVPKELLIRQINEGLKPSRDESIARIERLLEQLTK